MISKAKHHIDMRQGPLFSQIVRFTIPLILTGMLQLLYSAVDMIVVGQFDGDNAVAAVGCNTVLLTLLTGLFIGISAGSSIVIARAFGAKDYDSIERAIHTSIAMSLIIGILAAVLGFIFSEPLLNLLSTPADVLPKARTYLSIYFLGMPAFMVYNFGSSILRAFGDTKRPFYFLLISGVVNVAFNLLFVAVFKMGVAGVAIATIISQFVSMALVLYTIMNAEEPFKFIPKLMKVHKREMLDILNVGLPAGIQSSLFALSNVLIQGAVNSFGTAEFMAGVAASANLDTFVFIAMNALHQTVITFASQNLGAKQYKRMRQTLWSCLGFVTALGIIIGWSIYFFAPTLLLLYSDNPEVIEIAIIRLGYIILPQFTCGIMDVLSGYLRGMGYSVAPTAISFTCVCVLRIVWVNTIFAAHRTIGSLFILYPISWTLASIVLFAMYFIVIRKFPKENEPLNV